MTYILPLAALLVSGSILGGSAFAVAQTSSPANSSSSSVGIEAVIAPEDFVKAAAVSDAFEIASSQLALKRSQNAEIKAFAQQMITDHTKSTTELKAAAMTDGVTVDPALDAKHQDQLNMLQGAPAAQFDEKYTAAQTLAHTQAVSLFSSYASVGRAGAIKTFAGKTLPVLQMHLQHAQTLTGPKRGGR